MRSSHKHPHRAALALMAALVPACGPAVVATDDVPLLPPGAAPAVDGCAPPLLVPEGRAWVGGLRWIGGAIVPNGCDPPGAPGDVALRLRVPAFFLDPDEVTSACYARCVDDDACLPPAPSEPPWDDEAMTRVPTLLDQARAEAFCSWRGGRLPSLAELVRASHADALDVLNPALHDLWRRCMTPPGPPECEPLALLEKVESWPSPVRSWSLDRGPFGHHDLAASLIDLTMSKYAFSPEEQQALCELPLDAPDPRTFGSASVGFFPGAALLVDPSEHEDLAWKVWASPPEGAAHCAYDPAP